MRRHETERNNSWNRSQRELNRGDRSNANRRYTNDQNQLANSSNYDREDRYMGGSYGSDGDYSVDGVRFGNRDRDESGSRFSEGSDWNRSRFADTALGQDGFRYGHADHDRFERSRFDRYEDGRSQGSWGAGSENSRGSMNKTGDYNRDFSNRDSSGSHLYGQFRSERQDMGLHSGKGPKGYKRSDDRIKEEVCEALSRSPQVDASEIEVSVQEGTVTLSGIVDSRAAKREAENCIEHLSGVEDVHNEIRIKKGEGILSNLSGQKKEGTTTTNSSFRNEKLA